MDAIRIDENDSDYPKILRHRLGRDAPPCLYAMGEPSILRHRLLGLICSIQCPGSIVIQTFDATRALRDAGVVVVGGFHSPMEQECLDILLRGQQPVILCAAKGLAGLRIGRQARRAVQEGRLLALSPFAKSVRRTTAAQAVQRNSLVAALAHAAWAPYAAPGGKTETLCRKIIAIRQSLFTVDAPENANLLALGAKSPVVEELSVLGEGTAG